MSGTKVVCPHCTAILKSTKVLPVGKRITCVKCKQAFAFASEMIASSTADTHHDTAFSLAETQAGTLKSPIAGMTLPPPVAETPPPMEEPPPSVITRPYDRQRETSSQLALFAAFVLVVLVLLLGIGGGVVVYLFSQQGVSAEPQPIAEVKKPPVQDKPPVIAPPEELPKKIVQPIEKPKKKAPPIVPVAAPAKAEDKLADQIDRSTRKGVQFLRDKIKPSGTWKEDLDTHAVGYAALPALAMLECGVPPNDPAIQQAAGFVRANVGKVKETYDIGTAMLFLDALREPGDKKLILHLAARLMAGQTTGGGWTYECPLLSDDESTKLLAFLETQKPEIRLLIPLEQLSPDADPMPIKEPGKGGLIRKNVKKADKEPAEKPKAAPVVLSPKLQKLPIVAHQIKKLGLFESGADDNSNTHFALLGLWAARRHQAPVELSMSLATERFKTTQATDGGWGYVVRSPPKNTMTCVGLMGLAMGHGSAAEMFAEAAAQNKAPVKSLAKDAAIDEALKALGQYVDGDAKLFGLEARIDLYYLWSLERVGMLYRQKHFGKTEWFTYGAKLILEKQQKDGRWQVHYDAPIDTAFALLFLNRADLVEDLTNNLQVYLDIPLATPIEADRPRERPLRERERPRELREREIPR
jgi:hypothetical protein